MKIKSFFAILASATLLSGCAMGGSSTGSSLSSVGSGTGSAAGSSLAQTGAGVLGSLLSNLLGNATTNKQTILGTWTYNAPEVKFESENILSQVGGTVVSQKIQQTLGTQLTKIGLTKGKSTFTFNSDGTMQVTLGSKSTQGTYTYNQQNHTITMTGAFGLTNITATVAVTGKTMYLLFDSSKLLSIVTQLSKSTSATSTLSSLLGNYNGMKLGWSMTK